MNVKRYYTGGTNEAEKEFEKTIKASTIFNEVNPYLDPDTEESNFKFLTTIIDESHNSSGILSLITKVPDCSYIMNETVLNRIYEPDSTIWKDGRVIIVVADQVMKITLIPSDENEDFYEGMILEFMNHSIIDLIPREFLFIPTEV